MKPPRCARVCVFLTRGLYSLLLGKANWQWKRAQKTLRLFRNHRQRAHHSGKPISEKDLQESLEVIWEKSQVKLTIVGATYLSVGFLVFVGLRSGGLQGCMGRFRQSYSRVRPIRGYRGFRNRRRSFPDLTFWPICEAVIRVSGSDRRNLAEREGFEPSIQVLARITV